MIVKVLVVGARRIHVVVVERAQIMRPVSRARGSQHGRVPAWEVRVGVEIVCEGREIQLSIEVVEFVPLTGV
ncbi:uncharacterized protein MYCGRDRAFT_103332 [Zymoseptoria tritici IPO323]|uniref:Uncharacterized protein n=1 Tax=Zymoseptoria tritici (strain CBS 115943 / IPO323) TaxID=336722 RepID=F9X303_ZYMTI|nr:uncharacterized protein MYCGRDRAFT_103332 [Zymoseptoria tritici IPO323]EGP90430.1 hypothetical protein MYCGRDRAFT_103332 [Zymoseptoria tritici IPO323]